MYPTLRAMSRARSRVHSLFAVNNGESMVFELTLSGELVASWKLGIDDPEAITEHCG